MKESERWHAAAAAGRGAHLVQLLPAHGLQGQQRQVAAVQRGQRQRVHHLRTVGSGWSFRFHSPLEGCPPADSIHRQFSVCPSALAYCRQASRCTGASSRCKQPSSIICDVTKHPARSARARSRNHARTHREVEVDKGSKLVQPCCVCARHLSAHIYDRHRAADLVLDRPEVEHDLLQTCSPQSRHRSILTPLKLYLSGVRV